MNTGIFTNRIPHWGAKFSAQCSQGWSFLTGPSQHIKHHHQDYCHHPVKQAGWSRVLPLKKVASSPNELPKGGPAPGSDLFSPLPSSVVKSMILEADRSEFASPRKSYAISKPQFHPHKMGII